MHGPKALKIDIFDYLTVVWRTISKDPHEYPHKLYIAKIYSDWAYYSAEFIVFNILIYKKYLSATFRLRKIRSPSADPKYFAGPSAIRTPLIADGFGCKLSFLPARRYASAGLCDSDVSVCPSAARRYCA